MRAAVIAAQLALMLAVGYEVFFPRLGPLALAEYHFFAGIFAVLAAPLLVIANLAWTAGARHPRARLAPAALALAWVALAVAGVTWSRGRVARHLDASERVVAARFGCTPGEAEWYERGAEVYCTRLTPAGEREMLRVWASNGPFPWSDWQLEVGQRAVGGAWVD